jgi:hypothetical protein
MSAREMLKQDIDYMPEDVIEVIQAIWTFAKKRDFDGDIPNAETIAALNETEFTSFDSFEDYLKYIDEMEDDDEEI